METKQKEYNKVYAEYQKIKKCIESCETFEQLRTASEMAFRFKDYHKSKIPEVVEILYPLLKDSVLNKRISL